MNEPTAFASQLRSAALPVERAENFVQTNGIGFLSKREIAVLTFLSAPGVILFVVGAILLFLSAYLQLNGVAIAGAVCMTGLITIPCVLYVWEIFKFG